MILIIHNLLGLSQPDAHVDDPKLLDFNPGYLPHAPYSLLVVNDLNENMSGLVLVRMLKDGVCC
jgi:hypothetical protein